MHADENKKNAYIVRRRSDEFLVITPFQRAFHHNAMSSNTNRVSRMLTSQWKGRPSIADPRGTNQAQK